jgi:3-oxoadipate enol-lactonase
MTLAYEEHGAGKPVVLLHAFPLDRTMWRPQIDALRAANYRVILPDLKGFGENHAASDFNSMEEMAREVASFLDMIEIERAVIGGLSMGGYVTLNLFRLFPEKFSALLLFDTTSAADTDEKRQSRFEMIEKIERRGAAALIENMLPNLVSDHTKTEKPDLYQQINSMIEQVNPKAAIAALQAMAERSDHTALLKQITVPTLLIFGAEDKITDLETAEMMRSKISGAKLCVIPKAGHYSNLEAPDDFNRCLIQFLKSVPPA